MDDLPATPALVLPESLIAQGFALRRETDADLPFLIQVYGSSRAEEMAMVPWTLDEKNAFLLQQFGFQRRHYYHFHPTAAFDVIEQHGRPVGRLYLDERRIRFHVMDIALMPAERDKGTGTAIMRAIQDHAAARGKGVDLFVEPYRPAYNLYLRLGFTAINDDPVNIEMEWVPDGVT